MQIAVDPLHARRGERLGDCVGDAQGHVAVPRRQPFGDELALHDDVERLHDVALLVEPPAVGRVARGPHRVHPADRAADPPAILGVELVERPPAHLGKRRVEDPFDLAQRPAVAQVDRRDRRHLGGHQIGEERVLVEDRLARPAARAVELDHEPPLVLQLYLVDAVLERAQRHAAAGAAKATHLDRVQDPVGGQSEKRRYGLAGHA